MSKFKRQMGGKIFKAFAEVFPALLHYAADRGSMDHKLALLVVKNI